MKRILLFFLWMFFTLGVFAQNQSVSAKLIDSVSYLPVSGATVVLIPGNQTGITDANGRFFFPKISSTARSIVITAIGYRKEIVPLSDFKSGTSILLVQQQTVLSDVVITAQAPNPYQAISETDIKLRGVSNSQEILRMVPGLFIGQHQGGGKAEQIFLRGFDNDHGTDISLNVDGMPINLVSQAHGQGYADSHFIIPETIESTIYKKGPYDVKKGDLAVAGFVDFHTSDRIANTLKAEVGQYHTYCFLGMQNFLDPTKLNRQSWYAATEYRYSDGYFDHPQHFNRFNFFTKYRGGLSENNVLNISASTFYSRWDASGQIPENAVEQGKVGFYGALDPNEGGRTSRHNFNAQLLTTLSNYALIKNQFYYSRYKFDLHSNFTFFLIDTVHGDEIRQKESRNLYGYNGSFFHEGYWGNMKIATDLGLYTRVDATTNSELSHTVNRYTLINRIKLGDITEFSAGAYLGETFYWNEKFSLNAGLRFDQFYYRYNNKFAGDTTLNGAGLYKASNHIFSPKLNFYYQAKEQMQFYLFLDKGFHSNDTRVVVVENSLPAAYGIDLGTVLKPTKNLLLNAALWYSYLQKEFVYAGDGGTVDFSGRTRRLGVDLSARYQPYGAVYLDVDVNYAHGRAMDAPAGENFIPLAPVWSSTAGITYILKDGLNGSLRYRYLANRPANEDFSLAAKGYFVNDLVLNFTKPKFELGLTINNLLNVRWKETQFNTITRLKNEAPVDGITFTAGTKFATVFHFTYFLK